MNAVTDVNLVVSIQQLALLSALGNQLSDLVAQKQEGPAPTQPLKVGTDSGVESEQPQNSDDRCCRSFHWSKKYISDDHFDSGLLLLAALQLCLWKSC